MKAALGRLKRHSSRLCKSANEGKRKCEVPEEGMGMTWSRDGMVAARRWADGRRQGVRPRETERDRTGLQGCDDDSGCYFQGHHEGCEY